MFHQAWWRKIAKRFGRLKKPQTPIVIATTKTVRKLEDPFEEAGA